LVSIVTKQLNSSMKMTAFTTAVALRWLLALAIPMTVSGFVNQTHRRGAPLAFAPSHLAPKHRVPTKLNEVVTESGFENKMPPYSEAEAIGVRDWPQQTKMGQWTERFDIGQIAARYILEGAGMVVVTLFENDGFTPKTGLGEEYRVVPGNLVEVMGPAELQWQTDEGKEMIILSPRYEQGSLLAAVGALFIVICGALIAGVGQ
jgi:hypothetical protein